MNLIKRVKNVGRGFTLIELLVVISIISLFSSVVYVSLQGARVGAQDSKKVVETQQLQKAASLYRDNTGNLLGTPGVTYRESEGTEFTDVLQPLVEGEYISSVPDSPDDSYTYTNTGEIAIMESVLSGSVGYTIPTTCSGSIISSIEEGGDVIFAALTNRSSETSYDFTKYTIDIEDLDSQTGEITMSYTVGTCSDSGCFTLGGIWDLKYKPQSGECISPYGGVTSGEEYEYPAGEDLGRAVCQEVIDMAKLATTMTTNDVCQETGSYCTCTEF